MGKKETKGEKFSIDWDTSRPLPGTGKTSESRDESLMAINPGSKHTNPVRLVGKQVTHEHEHENQHSNGNGASISQSVNRHGESQWKPDIYVHAFVPEHLYTINQSPASFIPTPAAEGIDFADYIATFAGTQFLSPLKTPEFLKNSSPSSALTLDRLNPSTYESFFEDCLSLDLEARVPEIRSYDLFGATLELKDYVHQMYSLKVTGLKENTPLVSLGDRIMLRQLILDPTTRLPHGMSLWLAPGGGLSRGEPAPGFTGYQISAVVLGVDSFNETLFMRASGIEQAYTIVCNVSFVVQPRLIESVQRAVKDIAQELNIQSGDLGGTEATKAALRDSKPWLQRVLFPEEAYGIQQRQPPSARFSQTWFDPKLNYEQQKAVDAVQSRNYGDFCYLIHGPPGTGKTLTICEVATQLGKDTGLYGSILLCAPSNPAADTLALRLKGHFQPRELLRLNHFSRTFAEVPRELLPYCHVENDIFNLPPIDKLMAYKIVVTTCQAADLLVRARVTNRDLYLLHNEMAKIFRGVMYQQPNSLHWMALLIDEAAQATEPECLIPLTVVSPPCNSTHSMNPIFAMAGDQFQLGPRTYHRSTTLHISLFERLSTTAVYAAHPLARKSLHRTPHHTPMLRPPFVNLVRNYRSHSAILAVPSFLFYANTLIPEASQTESLNPWTCWLGRRWPVMFACNAGIDACEDIRGVGGGWYNLREAQKAIAYAQNLLAQGLIADQSEICIMSPFRAQVNRLRRLARHSMLSNVNIGPTEAFQGLERRFVILCTTRARKRFLEEDGLRGMGIVNESKKFNVAVTRAKEGLVVLGNPWVLATDPCWLTFMRFCWRNSLWQQDDHIHVFQEDFAEIDVNAWEPSPDPILEQGGSHSGLPGFEAALIYKELDKEVGSKAAKKFMNGIESQEEVLWRTGLEAQEAVDFPQQSETNVDEYDSFQ